jgi:transcription initiation factor TFIID subunit TAF12
VSQDVSVRVRSALPKIFKMKQFSKYDLDQITRRLELISKFSKILSEKLKIEKKIIEDYLPKLKKNKMIKDLTELEDKLLELNEEIEITYEEFKGLTLRQVDDGEGIEAYGYKQWLQIKRKKRRESQTGKAILNLLKYQKNLKDNELLGIKKLKS